MGVYQGIAILSICHQSTAKLFGFKSAIAHGMWSKSRCIAALEDQLPESGYSVDVVFHRPYTCLLQ